MCTMVDMYTIPRRDTDYEVFSYSTYVNTHRQPTALSREIVKGRVRRRLYEAAEYSISSTLPLFLCSLLLLPSRKMCTYLTRVSRCGHYSKELDVPCKKAKKDKEPCDTESGTAATTGGECYISGCDKKPNPKREGPG